MAGPFRGQSSWEVESNVRRAEEVGAWLVKQGVFPVIPHAIGRFFQGYGPESGVDRFWLDGTLELMLRCDVVIMTPSWGRSTGATNEKRVAEEVGIPVLRFRWFDTDALSERLAALLRLKIAGE